MRRGRVEVVCGSMFSGKTEELIRRLRRAQFAKQRVEIFKPSIDVRYSEEEVVSHEGNSILSTPVDSSASILLMGQESDVVGIDEAQFFDEHIVEVCNELASRGIRVIVAGLDLDFKGQPFGPMPQLCAIADEVTKVHAICVRCGALAYVSHRIVAGESATLWPFRSSSLGYALWSDKASLEKVHVLMAISTRTYDEKYTYLW